MLFKVAVAAALVAAPLAVNATCGDLKWPCCDIPDNDPNGGTCRDDTLLTCWEGACKRCGTDGMPACAGSKPCTGKLIVKNDFCTFDNTMPPAPPTPSPQPAAAEAPAPAEAPPAFMSCGDLKWPCCDIPDNDPNGGTCRDDTILTCWEGACKRCGTDGMPACAGSKPCTGKLIVKNDFCTFDNTAPPAPSPEPAAAEAPAPAKPALAFMGCGDLKWPCCDIPDNDPNGGTCRDDTILTCWEGACKRCGTDGMPACAGSKPCTGKLIVKNDFCTFDNTAPPAPSPEPAAAAAPAPAKPAPAFMGCGDLKWPCCDIPDNDPNGGTCRDDTILTCWEGACKRCGTDGMPACAGSKPCTGKLIVKNDFCTFDNTAPPAPPTPSPKPAPAFMGCGDLKWPCCDIPDNDPNGGTCRDDTILTCWEGACKRCGTDGMPACAGPKPCTGQLIIRNDFCTFDNGQH